MLELSITNYQMRRPPMATNVRALNDMMAMMVIHASENDYVKKMIATAYSLQKQNQVSIEQDPGGANYNLSRNFKDSVGTLYLRENRKIHFEIDTAYDEEIEIKAFFSKKVEKRHHLACITGIVPFTFDNLMEIRLSGNRIIFSYSLTPDGKGQVRQFGFEMADVRQFARDLYEWAERKNFKLIKAIDEEMQKAVVDTAPAPAPPPEGTLYSVLVDPNNQHIEFGKTLQFTAKPIDVKGNLVPVSSIKWSVDPPTIGSITPDGLFTPKTDNAKVTIIVSASSGEYSTHGFATVQIVPAQILHAPPPAQPQTVNPASPAPAYSAPVSQQTYTPPPPPPAQVHPTAPAAYIAPHPAPAAVQRPPPPPPPPQPAGGKPCSTCGTPLNFSAQYNRWYCSKCQKWE